MSTPGADTIPYGALETLFLDVGNTIVSMDFAWVSRELERLGLACPAAELERAEAAARPGFSALVARTGPAPPNLFALYIGAVMEALPPGRLPPDLDRSAVCGRLVEVLCAPGLMTRLWSNVLAGVPEALDRFAALGLRMVAVSNSDGTVEAGLAEQGLRDHFDLVVDSGIVGFEKPDPRIFRHALTAARAAPDRTLHVGDMYFADVVGARDAGIHALLLDPYGDWDGCDCARLPHLPALADEIARSRRS